LIYWIFNALAEALASLISSYLFLFSSFFLIFSSWAYFKVICWSLGSWAFLTLPCKILRVVWLALANFEAS
jgi:hypothetical protein